MFQIRLIALAVAAAFAVPAAHAAAPAAATLLAQGSMSATASDLSGLSGALENGASANLMGGMGSGLAWAGGNTFLALPDRAPNALAWNSAVDNTASYVARFNTIQLKLSATPTGALPYSLTPTLSSTALL